MRNICVMLKPASSLCNMRCKYCFYADETACREIADYGVMTPEVQEAITKRVLSYVKGTCTLAFQGGEPTLAGLDFFHRQAELERKYNVNQAEIHHAIQTNGLLINNEWASFLAQHHYLVGVSLDGPKSLHDANRLDAAGRGTYNRVIQTLQVLRKYHVKTNILTVLTKQNARAINRIYGFFKRSGFLWQQYIPCLDPLGEKRGNHYYSLTSDGFEFYLKTIFDFWYQDAMRGNLLYHRYFFNLLAILSGQPPEACDMNGVCGIQYVVEADGSVFPCDFYMLDKWKLGNFITDGFSEIDARRAELRFVELSREALAECLLCKWYPLCRGGCRRDREGIYGDPLGENYFCNAYRNFFEYALPRLQQILVLIQNSRIHLPIG